MICSLSTASQPRLQPSSSLRSGSVPWFHTTINKTILSLVVFQLCSNRLHVVWSKRQFADRPECVETCLRTLHNNWKSVKFKCLHKLLSNCNMRICPWCWKPGCTLRTPESFHFLCFFFFPWVTWQTTVALSRDSNDSSLDFELYGSSSGGETDR